MVELGMYSTREGLQLKWADGYELRVAVAAGEIVISGNARGLGSLAGHLLTLAQDHVPSGVHAHLEPGLELEDDSKPFVVEKVG